MNNPLNLGVILVAAAFALVFVLTTFRFGQSRVTQAVFGVLIFVIAILLLEWVRDAFFDGRSAATVTAVIYVTSALLWLVVFRLLNAYDSNGGRSTDFLKKFVDEVQGKAAVIIDQAGQMLYVNRYFQKLCGLDKHMLLKQKFDNIVHCPQSKLVTMFGGEDSLEDKTFDDSHCRLDRKDGSSLSLKVNRYRVSDSLLILFSQQKENDNYQFFRSAYFDFAPLMFVVLDSDGRVVMINNYSSKLLGLSESEVVGSAWFDTFTLEETDKSKLLLNKCLNGTQFETYDSRIHTLSGLERIMRWSCKSFKPGDGGSLYILLSGQDITEWESEHIELVRSLDKLNTLKDRLEERVVERTRKLRDINVNLQLQIDERRLIEERLISSQRLHQAVVDNFPNGLIAVINPALQYVMVSGRDLSVLDVASENFVGRYIFEDRDGLLPEYVRPILERAFNGESSSLELRKKEFVYNMNVLPLADDRNVIDEVLIVLHNITENKKLEQSLYKTIEEEKKLNDLKSRFVTMASHEFRTPLSTILSSVFLLENYNGERYEENKHIHIDRIKRTVNVLTDTLNDFLRLGTLEEGLVNIVLTEVSLHEEVAQVVTEMEPHLKDGQTIMIRHDSRDRKVLLDRHILRSVLTNLLSNAIKYSYNDGCVLITTDLSDVAMTIRVADTGIGIAEEEKHHIFQRFFRGMNAVNIEGTGLGLHIVKQYVNLLHGSIDFESAENGTEFKVQIPLKRTQDNARLILR